jgi:hypothetical protein
MGERPSIGEPIGPEAKSEMGMAGPTILSGEVPQAIERA